MNDKGRKLTKKEQQRKLEFERISAELIAEGYEKHDLTVGVVFANVMAIVMTLPYIVVLTFIYFKVNWSGMDDLFLRSSILDTILFIVLFFLFVVVHELIHGLTWGILSENHFKSIKFGVIWSMATPYCTCSDPLRKWQYVLGGLMPTLILGFGLAAISIAAGIGWLFALSQVMILSGGGDFLIVAKLLMYRPGGREAVYFDHPYECGMVAFEK